MHSETWFERKGDFRCWRGEGALVTKKGERVESPGLDKRRTLLQSHWLEKSVWLIFMSFCHHWGSMIGVLEIYGLNWDRDMRVLPYS